MKSFSLFAFALLASTATSTPLVAAEADRVTTIVPTADLDLSSESGRRMLDQRIARAAHEVCGTASDADLEGKNAVRNCRARVIAEAAAQRDQLMAAKRGGTVTIAAAR